MIRESDCYMCVHCAIWYSKSVIRLVFIFNLAITLFLQFSDDGNWYRASVMKKSASEAEVVYIDFGNSENIPHNEFEMVRQFSFTEILQIECHGMLVFHQKL